MDILEIIFGWICHQLPGRSPHEGDLIFPLCYRCAGLYLGLLGGYLSLIVSGGWRRSAASNRRLIALGLLMVPFLVDGWGNTLALWASPGWIRASTGAATGVMLSMVLLPAATPVSGRPAETTRQAAPLTSGRPAELAAALGIAGVLIVLLDRSSGEALYVTLAAGAAAGLGILVANLLSIPANGNSIDSIKRMRSCVRIQYRTTSPD